MTLSISYRDFDGTVALVRHLVARPPWHRPERATGQQNDRALRAEYRHWTSADVEPTPLMLAPLWQRTPVDGWRGLDEASVDRGVHLAAIVLHLVALAEGGAGRETPTGAPVDNLGRAARDAGVAEVRWARIVNAAPSVRLDAVGRLMRQIGRAGVPYRVAAPRADDEDAPDRRSTRQTLHHPQRDDLAALVAFLFTADSKPAASRWTAGYYHTSLTPTAAEAA